MSDTARTEQHDFSAEVGRLLDLVVNALYSDREIFLRELVANAADAIDRRRFLALTEPALSLPEGAAVRVTPDKGGRQLAIADDGIGMSKADLAANLGTIARSGTRAFGAQVADAAPDQRPSLIGQFGVGFYSAFMVAERVEVVSRLAGSEEAWRWASDGHGSFTLAPAERETPGTEVVLHIKPDAEEFLDPIRLETIIRKWADHIAVPLLLVQDGKALPANEGTALWRKPKAEITEQTYAAFYRHLGNLFDSPWATLHWRAEGAIDFAALLFIPGSRPFEAVEGVRESRVRLHVRRMFITDQAGLLPPWLRFVQGVVDTEDLPLNVSREMLQTTPVLARIRKALVNRVLGELKTRAKDAAEYTAFWDNFGPVLKEGVWEDADHRTELAPLLRFRSTTTEGWTSLPDYIARMPAGQEAIYVLAGDNEATLRTAPQLEGFRARGFEVLLLPDPIDAFWPDRLDRFDGKPVRSVRRAAADLGDAAAPAADAPDPAPLIAALKTALGEAVSDVRVSASLVDSPVMLAAAATGPDLHMQRLLRRAGRDMPGAPPVLEINPRHALIAALIAGAENGAEIGDAAHILLDLARVQEGEAPADPAAFVRRVAGRLAATPSAA